MKCTVRQYAHTHTYYILYTIYHILYTMYYILCTMYYMLYAICYMLYALYYILYMSNVSILLITRSVHVDTYTSIALMI
jgi:hypothetical protein